VMKQSPTLQEIARTVSATVTPLRSVPRNDKRRLNSYLFSTVSPRTYLEPQPDFFLKMMKSHTHCSGSAE
jgi:hypothetical protein